MSGEEYLKRGGLLSILTPACVKNLYFPSALKMGVYSAESTHLPHIMSTPPPPPPPTFRISNIIDSQILNSMNSNTLLYVLCKQMQIDVLVQERRNSNALAIELRLFCTYPSKCRGRCHCCGVACTAAPFVRKLCVP